jgi:hypothetical protein
MIGILVGVLIGMALHGTYAYACSVMHDNGHL